MSFKNQIREERNKIKEELISIGYANKSIGYMEFKELYKKYECIISEKEFAIILGINERRFTFLKNGYTKKTIILQRNFSEEKISEIINVLHEQGYTNKKIDYKEFLELYKKYKKDITECKFAEILGIKYHSFCHLRNGSKTIILKKQIDKDKIRSEVEEEYGTIFVTYEEFLSIYRKYEKLINSELHFAEIIGITKSNLSKIKKGTKTKILKRKAIEKELREIIREDIINQGYRNKMISYEEFLVLYDKYNYITEEQFAEVLSISPEKLYNMKKNNNKTVCLKEIKELSPSFERKIREELISQGYLNKKIDYEEFMRFI